MRGQTARPYRDAELREPRRALRPQQILRVLHQLASPEAEIRKVAAVDSYPQGNVPARSERERDGQKVGHPRLEHVVRVHQGEKIRRESEGVRSESREFALIRLRPP